MTELTTLQTYRDEAIAARHALMTNGGVVEVRRADRSMRFSTATLRELTAYIAELDRDIAAATNEAAGRPRRSAIGIRW